MPMLFATLSLAVLMTGAAPDSAELRGEALMEALRKGGYTVLLRHARTDRSFQEEVRTMPTARSAQRNLNDDGVRDALLMGVVFRSNCIAFGEVVSSPMYRATETAQFAAGKPDTTMALRTFPTTAETRAVVMRAPKPGTNRLIVTHHFVIEEYVPGIRPGDIGESEAAVVRNTRSGGIELVGRILLADWTALATPRPEATHKGCASASHGAPAQANAGTAGASIPDTHAGHLAREYIRVFNSGDTAAMRRYVESYMLPDPSRQMEERLRTYETLRDTYGILTVDAVTESTATSLTLRTRSRQGALVLTVSSSAEQPMRVSSIRFGVPKTGGHN